MSGTDPTPEVTGARERLTAFVAAAKRQRDADLDRFYMIHNDVDAGPATLSIHDLAAVLGPSALSPAAVPQGRDEGRSPDTDTDRLPRVYVASKSKYGRLWRERRDEWADRLTITATWIDESEMGATEDHADLWRRCVAEAAQADALVAVHHDGEAWKGAYVEIGAALAHGVPVFVVGEPPGSFVHHPLIARCDEVGEALDAARLSAAALDAVTPRGPEARCAVTVEDLLSHLDAGGAIEWRSGPPTGWLPIGPGEARRMLDPLALGTFVDALRPAPDPAAGRPGASGDAPDAATLLHLLRQACHDGWSDGEGALAYYLRIGEAGIPEEARRAE
jgi:hypothetical protein